MRLSIIYPCYNEEENIHLIEKELINVLKNEVESLEIIAVDDGSKDKTYNKLKFLQRKYPFIKIIKHDNNKGLGVALKTGIENSSYEFIVTLDADLTFHPRQIKYLIKAYKENEVDFVVGSPFLFGYNKNIPKYRLFLSWACNLLYRIVLGRKITAITPIFRFYQAKDLKKLKIENSGFDANAEIMAKLILQGKKFIEIPVELTKRKYGSSKLNNLKEAKNHLKIIGKILVWRFLHWNSA